MNADFCDWRSWANSNYVRRKWCVQEDVVISGMSGRFPQSTNIQEFTENLFGGVDMMTGGNDRFPSGMGGFPMKSGKVGNLEDFDAEFFGIPHEDANLMDPQLRKLLEASFEAVVDAGIPVRGLRESNTGFYYASFIQETDKAFGNDPYTTPAYLQQHSNIISRVFGLKGPIGHYDTACGSSFSALNEAFTALKSGLCDRALVAGYNICLRPMITLEFNDLQMVSPSGHSKSLDKSADGYGRSEAICCVMLQLRPEAKRIYSTIVNSRSNNDGYKEQGITFPSMTAQRRLIAETYDEVGLDPSIIDYVEAHATGTQAGDPVELEAIYDIFCQQRSSENPLKIGCIKSNMGHSEAASGLCALIKANVIFQCGYIPPNLHLKEPNPKIKGLMDGKMMAIVEKTSFNGEYISLNSFGFGGSNAHVILKRHAVKSSESSLEICDKVPRLVPICSRTLGGIQRVQNFLKRNQCLLTKEFFGLLGIYSITSSMPHKGYTLMSKKDGQIILENSKPNYQLDSFHYAAMVLPIHSIKFDPTFEHIQSFSSTFNRLKKHAKNFKIELADLLLGNSSPMSINEENVATIATQLILINLLKAIEVTINCYIGNSVGHLAHASTENLISEEEAIRAAYWMGHSIDQKSDHPERIRVNKEKNTENMNAASRNGKKFKNMSDQMNSNSKDSPEVSSSYLDDSFCNASISYESFVQNLQRSRNENEMESSAIFVRLSIPRDTSTHVLNKEINFLPVNSLVIESGPFKTQRSDLKSVRFSNSQYLGVDEFLKSVGQLYALNLPLNIKSLYPPVDYPVPIDTLSLHSLIEFDHSHKYEVFKYPEYFKYFSQTSSFVFKVSLSDAGDLFYSDHKIDGRILFPATGILMQVWLVVAEYHHVNLRKSKVLFSNVSLIRATMLSEKEVSFKVDYMPETNSFITSESDTPIATGKVFLVSNIEEAKENFQISSSDGSANTEESLNLSREDVYKELRNRGYDYGPSFRCLTKADQFGRSGEVEWREVSSITLKGDTIFEKTHEADFDFLKTWITFSDSVLQLAILSNRYNRGLFLPTGIESMLIDAERIMEEINASKNLDQMVEFEIGKEEIGSQKNGIRKDSPEQTVKGPKNSVKFSVQHDLQVKTLDCRGLWIRGLKTSFASRRSQKVLIETQDFIPFNEQITLDAKYCVNLQNYVKACEKYSSLLLKKSSIEPEDIETLKQDFPCEENSSYALLAHLISILERKKQPLDPQKIAHDMLIGKDLHFSSLSRFLKPFVMIPLNIQTFCGQTNSSIAVLEFNDGKNLLMETIRACINSQTLGMARLTYTLASCNDNQEIKQIIAGKAAFIQWNAESILENFSPVDLLIFKNYSGGISSFRAKIKNLLRAIKDGGFLLIVFREGLSGIKEICSNPQLNDILADAEAHCMKSEDIISLLDDMNWTCVSNRILEPGVLAIRGLLFRAKPNSIQTPEIVFASPSKYDWIEKVKIAIKKKDERVPIYLIGDPSYDQGVVGLVKSLGYESFGDRIICIANRYHDDGINFESEKWKNVDLKQIMERRLKFNIYDPHLGWGENIHLEAEEKHEEDPRCSVETSNDVELKVLQPGDLSSLKWRESPVMRFPSSCSQWVVKIFYAPLNFKDVLLASGRLPVVFEPGSSRIGEDLTSVKIGLEYSGIDDKGNRLMGMKSSGAMASRVLLNPTDFVWPVPDDWTLEDAATVPVVYATVIYGLIMRGNLKRGESVLIHAGSGGVGIAAINICLSYDCTIYTTVGTPEKRRFITETFPHLNEANIGNSRDTSFEELIFRQTGGRGVDIVLNSLADDKLQASIRCLAPGGRFIEIGKYDGFKNSPVDLGWLDQDRSFHGVMLDALFDPKKDEIVKVNYQKNQLQNLVTKFLNNGVIKPLPRTVFEMKDAEDAFRYMAAGKHIGKVVIEMRDPQTHSSRPIPALNLPNFHPNKSYIIIGGFGGLGLELASWLVSRGARNIVINSRNGPQNSYHRYSLDKMTESDVQVVVSKHDLTTKAESRELLSSLTFPVGGIFNSALVLEDALFVDQTIESFQKVCDSKINITINMDQLSREMCPSLDYFVVFSSIVSGRGNPGQTNYSFANSFMESVCERRRRDGLHGLAIQWGFVGDVGYVVEKIGADIESIRRTAPQRLHSCLATLERILTYPNAVTSSMVRSEGKTIESSGDIIKSICYILGLKNIFTLDPMISLGELGMDSLMAIEVQQALDRNFNVSMTFREIRQLKICDLVALPKNSDSGSIVQSKSEPIDSDLMKESESLPSMPTTKLNKGNGEPLFVFPPIEGHYHPFCGLFENLNRTVVGLNWTYDLVDLTTIEEAAIKFADLITSLSHTSKLNMIGYSFGGILALATAKELRERPSGPKVAKLALLDADPQYLKKYVLEMIFSGLSSGSENFEEEKFVKTCLKRYLGNIPQFDEDLKKATSRSERFEVAKNILISENINPLIADNLMKLNELLLQKCFMISKYNYSSLSDCEILHLRSKDDFPSLLNTNKDTSIGEQYFFDGNHNNFIVKNLTEISTKIIKFFEE